MNGGSNGTHNSAAYDSTVGIQAETVHNSNVYFVHPDASPQEKYKVGVRFLEDGIPSRAREMISDAIAHGHDNAEVRFHWVLAMLSARAYHDLSAEELQRLHIASGLVRTYAEGEWKDALRVAFELLAMLSTADGETVRVLERLRALSPRQRDLILHHLDLVLTGGLRTACGPRTASGPRRRASATTGSNGSGPISNPTPSGHGPCRPALAPLLPPGQPSRSVSACSSSSPHSSGSWRWSRIRLRQSSSYWWGSVRA
jgi:hypothetical protein